MDDYKSVPLKRIGTVVVVKKEEWHGMLQRLMEQNLLLAEAKHCLEKIATNCCGRALHPCDQCAEIRAVFSKLEGRE